MSYPDPLILAREYEGGRYAARYMSDEERRVVVNALRLYAKALAAPATVVVNGEQLAGGALEGNS